MESDSLGSGDTIGSWNVRVDFFNPESPVESDSLGSRVTICCWNARVGVSQSRDSGGSLFYPGVWCRVGVQARVLAVAPGI